MVFTNVSEMFDINVSNCHLLGEGGHSLTKVMGAPTLRFSARVVQQLKMRPKADTKSHFWHPRAGTIPHFDSPRADI